MITPNAGEGGETLDLADFAGGGAGALQDSSASLINATRTFLTTLPRSRGRLFEKNDK